MRLMKASTSLLAVLSKAMVSYRDMTFCHSDCMNAKCSRHFSDEVLERALQWWGADDPPIAMSDFHENCEEYMAPNGTNPPQKK